MVIPMPMTSAGDNTPRLPAHIYVPVPICRSKCVYCDFYSVPLAVVAEGTGSIAGSLAAQARAWLDRGLAPQLFGRVRSAGRPHADAARRRAMAYDRARVASWK